MIHLEKVGVFLKSGNWLNDVTYSFKSGEHVAVYGKVGSGLSALSHILSGRLRPHAGIVSYNGRSIHSLNGAPQNPVGLVTAPILSDSRLTVHEYGQLICQSQNLSVEALEQRYPQYRLETLRDHPLNTLSLIQKQCLNLCLASLSPEDYLILVNPYQGLGGTDSRTLKSLVSHVMSDKTVILLSEQLQDISQAFDTLLILKAGKIAQVLNLENLIQASTLQIKMSCRSQDQHVLEKVQDLKTVYQASAIEDNLEWQLDIIPKTNSKDCRESLYQTAKKYQWTLHTLTDKESTIEEMLRHALGESL